VNSKDGQTEVGKISKQWSGLLREYFTDADNFGISCKKLDLYFIISTFFPYDIYFSQFIFS
jgi:hypothetical protein